MKNLTSGRKRMIMCIHMIVSARMAIVPHVTSAKTMILILFLFYFVLFYFFVGERPPRWLVTGLLRVAHSLHGCKDLAHPNLKEKKKKA